MSPRRIGRSAALALVTALIAAGCGSSSSSSSSSGGSSSSGAGTSTSTTGAAAGNTGTSASASSGCGPNHKVKSVAFFGFAASNSFAQATWKGVQQAARACGATAKFFDPNFIAQTQVNQMEDAITTGQYQVFVVQANDGLAVVPAVERAIRQGITVVGEFTQIGSRYDTIQPQVPGLIFVGEGSVQNGKALGQLGIEACKGLNPCKVAYFQGFKTLPLDNARTAAVMQTLKTASNVQVVASPQGGYTPSTGLAAAQDVLSAHPDVNVIIGSSQAIEGAQLALKRAGKLGKIKLIGNGGSCQAIQGVLSGTWFASYIVAERSDGEIATKFGIQAANGMSVPHAYSIDQIQNPLGTKPVIEKTHFTAQYCD
jgi:ribose transport system substrate-binding protein